MKFVVVETIRIMILLTVRLAAVPVSNVTYSTGATPHGAIWKGGFENRQVAMLVGKAL